MKLLIVTQVVDIEHPILGFFHRWIIEFAKHYQHVHVICLQEGKHNLPDNVSVYSLGKETGHGNKLSYLIRFYKLIFTLRNDYDRVFVHMNQIYVILGGLFWRLFNKKIGFWYAHGAVTLTLYFSALISNLVFTSTVQGMRINTNKRKVVGQGVDIDLFLDKSKRIRTGGIVQLITVGRISQSKNIETLLRACEILKNESFPFIFTIVGTSTTKEEFAYENKVKRMSKDLDLDKNVRWHGPVTNVALPDLLKKSDIFMHDGSTNSLDKSLVEASVSGCVVLSSNPAYRHVTELIAGHYLYKKGQFTELAKIIKDINFEDYRIELVKSYFVDNFGIDRLIEKISNKY